ncbi:Serine/threonine-protein phosphatase 2B catalytic subunit [Trichinella pseudospiralis]
MGGDLEKAHFFKLSSALCLQFLSISSKLHNIGRRRSLIKTAEEEGERTLLLGAVGIIFEGVANDETSFENILKGAVERERGWSLMCRPVSTDENLQFAKLDRIDASFIDFDWSSISFFFTCEVRLGLEAAIYFK